MDDERLDNPWLVAAWPGIGAVAANAGLYLVQQLGAKLVRELPSKDLFEVQHVDVKRGVATPARLPRNMIFEWRDPRSRRDLLIFVSEAQPQRGGYALCKKLVAYARNRGIERIVTFAAMATQLHPSTAPRVFGATTESDLLPDLRRHDVELLAEGQISGLNGVLLAAGLEQRVPGICLLGELPFFAVGVPNPRASQAVVEVFSAMTDIHIDLADIKESAAEAEGQLLQLLEQLKEAAREQVADEGVEDFSIEDIVEDDGEERAAVDNTTRRRIEGLFEQAQNDRSKAFELKAFLDHHGVFGEYEDRFLDLFKSGE